MSKQVLGNLALNVGECCLQGLLLLHLFDAEVILGITGVLGKEGGNLPLRSELVKLGVVLGLQLLLVRV